MISLGDYSAKKIAFLKKGGASCVYVVTTSEGKPTKIGIASNIRTRFGAIQTANWVKLRIEFLLWFPGREASLRVESEILKKLSCNVISGEWVDLEAADVVSVVKEMSFKLYPTLFILTHEQMIGMLRKHLIDKRDHVGPGEKRAYSRMIR